MKSFKLLFISIIIIYGCNSQPSIKLENGAWATAIEYNTDNNQFTPNLIINLKNNSISVQQFGSGKQLFDLPYKIESNNLYLENSKVPFLKMISQVDNKLLVSFGKGDTTVLHKIEKRIHSSSEIQKRLIGHTFELISPDKKERNYIFWGKDAILFLSNDIVNSKAKHPSLNFRRVPYQMDFSNEIPTIIIGDYTSAEITKLSNGNFDVLNLIIGQIKLNSATIDLISYGPDTDRKYALIPLTNKLENDAASLEGSEWKLGGSNKFVLNYKDAQQLVCTKNGKISILTCNLDESCHIITMVEESGNKLYAIRDFRLTKKRIGFEISEGRFMDLLNLSSN